MRLGQAPPKYDRADQDRTRSAISEEFDQNFRKGGTMEIGRGRLVLTDTVTGARYELTVASGALTLTLATL